MLFSKIAMVPILLAAGVNAWDLTVIGVNDRQVRTHGTTNSGCVNYDFSMSSPIKRVVFHESFFADTFELYEEKDCKTLSYREGKGDFTITPRTIRSYKVY